MLVASRVDKVQGLLLVVHGRPTILIKTNVLSRAKRARPQAVARVTISRGLVAARRTALRS